MLINKKISVLYFIRLLRTDLLTIAVYAVLIGTLDHYGFLKQIQIPLPLAAFVGTTISLLLAFRTSQSYERWWEARVVWGGIVNDSRTLIRQLGQFLPRTMVGEQVLKSYAERQSIWCYALGESLRKVPFSPKVSAYLKKHNIKGANLPNSLLDIHATELAWACEQFSINANKQVQVDSTIARLCDSMGKCERIKNTVFPRSYSVLIHFLIYVLMTILPFGLEDKSVAVEILLTFLVPVLFIMIERTAIFMQDPFENLPTDTPMTALSMTIERNLMEMVNSTAPEQQQQPDTYYIM